MAHRAWSLAAVLILATPCAAQVQTSPPSGSEGPSSPPPAVQPAPPDFPRGKISGYMFGDYYYNVDGNPTHVYDANGADLGQTNIDGKNSITKDLNGVQLRRAYFQLDNDLNVRFSTRFRLEADGKSLTSDGKIGVAVKAAYIQARSLVPRGDFFFGVLSTPTFENSEEFWAYRAIEKTLVDFRGLVPSADLGVELKGFVDPNHHLGYSAMIGDGPGQKVENDRFKRYYLSLPLRFGDLRLEPYVDYQPIRVTAAAINNDQATYKVFAGYDLHRGALGVEAVDRVDHEGASPNQEPRGLSIFARGTATTTLGAFARVDFWEPDKRNPNRVDSQLWIAGLDWAPYKDVHVMPNFEATQYTAQGSGVVPAHHDLQARVTFYYKFSGPHS